MRIHLEQLPHQELAISKVLDAFRDCLDTTSDIHVSSVSSQANPLLKRMRGIDVKMETGTGKTYVYTRLMHELYQSFGLNKFIILTPSLAIKEGTKSFITSEYANQHFRELFGSQKLNLGVVNAGDFSTKKGKRKQFAGSLSDYCEASINDIGKINALLLNDAMLGSSSMTRDDYDRTLIGGNTCPIDALKLTRPIVIVDEPHRFKKDSTAWSNILSLNPQVIIRFGATFPEKTIGAGRNKVVKKDYDNLVYDLNAVESFNRGLVKAIDVNYPNLPEDQATVKYRVESATSQEMTLSKDGRQWTIKTGEDLSIIDPMFEGDTTYEGKRLSNELEVAPGMTLMPGTWSNSYQELIIRQAIDAHFEKEYELFHRQANAPRVKVLSLYFIDSIASYRASDGWLKIIFERLLDEKLTALIAKSDGEYKEFLKATKVSLHSDIQNVHAGYFSEDTGKKGDDAIQAEVDDILRNKEQLLQFKDEKGNWNVRRFLFSKWTLREGWDNPNVFVLTKLRSSGSENSKLQEVGRGLRLPVDELGNRLSDEEFRLHFIVDYSERAFAQKLVAEVNADGGRLEAGKITDDILEALVNSGYSSDVAGAKKKLLVNDIIDFDQVVQNVEELEKLVSLGIAQGKIRENALKKPKVRLRKDNWNKISSLWEETSRRFMLQYDKLSREEIVSLAEATIDPSIFSNSWGRVTRYHVEYNAETASVELAEETVILEREYGHIKYKDFLKRLHKITNLPINTLHTAVLRALDGVDKPNQKFNEITLQNAKERFEQKFVELFSQRFEYDPLDFTASISIFDDNDQLVDELDQGIVGTTLARDVSVPDNYLYDEAVFDSDIEHEIIKIQPPQEVLVFGKLPRKSIRIPTFTGGTSSPDFIYALRESDSEKIKIHALIEAKGKSSANQSDIEKVALGSQAKLSERLKGIELRLVTDSREVSSLLKELT